MVWGAIAKAIPAAVQAGTAIYSATQAANRDPYSETLLPQQQEALASQRKALEAQRVYQQAALNPESPHFRALVALQEAQRKRDVLQAIDMIQRKQNRARARGVMGALVNPERRDESIASAIASQFAESGDIARQQAAGLLGNAAQLSSQRAQGFGAAAQGFNNPNQLLTGYADERTRQQANIAGAIGDFATSSQFRDALSGLFGGSKPAIQAPPVQGYAASGGPYGSADDLIYKRQFSSEGF